MPTQLRFPALAGRLGGFAFVVLALVLGTAMLYGSIRRLAAPIEIAHDMPTAATFAVAGPGSQTASDPRRAAIASGSRPNARAAVTRPQAAKAPWIVAPRRPAFAINDVRALSPRARERPPDTHSHRAPRVAPRRFAPIGSGTRADVSAGVRALVSSEARAHDRSRRAHPRSERRSRLPSRPYVVPQGYELRPAIVIVDGAKGLAADASALPTIRRRRR